MIGHLRRYRLMLRAVIYLLPLLSFFVANFVYFHWIKVTPRLAPPNYLYLALFTTLVWSIVAEKEEVTSISKVSAEHTGVRACFSACGITYLANLIALFLVHNFIYSRAVFLLSAFTLLALAVLVRTMFRLMLRQFAGRTRAIKVIVVGTGRFAARAAMQVKHNEFAPCNVLGYIQLPGEEIHVSHAPILQLTDLERIESLEADDILVAIPPDRYGELRRCISKLQILGKPVRIIVNAGNGMKVHDRVVELGRLQMLDLDPGPASSIGYFFVKRGFDIVFSSVVLLVCALPMLIIGTVIKLTSSGPVFFRQQRVGKNGRLFAMYKFRTMRVASETEGDTRWTSKNDPRCTPFGAFLRKTSLDELPQFFNVLKGDMSVVGPRPERPHFVKKFRSDIAFYQARHHLKVGITGWAQVNGLRGDSSIQRRVRYDLYYLQHWSLLFDMRIILMTVWGGFTDKNAY